MDSHLRHAGVFSLLFSLHLVASAGQSRDQLEPGQAISDGQTLTSPGGHFSLGFFSPSNRTKNRYVGIWFSNIPETEKTVVWVANREQPVVDSSGVLKLTEGGDLRVADGDGRIYWSSNSSKASLQMNASVVLLDTGNLIVQAITVGGNSRDEQILWQSFQHPTDTWLPTMNLELDVSTGARTQLVSWRSPEDPSPGEFSLGIDPEMRLQIKIRRGNETIQRSFIANEQLMANERDRASSTAVVTVVDRVGDRYSVSFTITTGASQGRLVLDHTGFRRKLLWIDTARKWVEFSPDSQKPCLSYDRCGPNAFCEEGPGSPTNNGTRVPISFNCSCLDGFDPRVRWQWDAGNFSAGCVRRDPIVTSTNMCATTETAMIPFKTISSVKLPDMFRLFENASSAQCEAACVSNCTCTAYSFSNLGLLNISSSRCFLWDGELKDVWRLTSGSDALPIFGTEFKFRVSASRSGKKQTTVIIVLAVVGAASLLLLGVFSYFMVRRYRSKKQATKTKTVMFDNFGVPDIFKNEDTNRDDSCPLSALDFDSLVIATDNFSSRNILGEGGFGPVYKGLLPQGQEVAIKKLSRFSDQGDDEFKNEVELIARLQHTNLVQLLGWCMHDGQKMLIYEYLPNKSLDKFIFDSSRKAELDWKKRFGIIHGIAQGLLYLHRYSRLRIIHRDLKTSNVLLDGEMNPKISDFGLARVFQQGQNEANTNTVVGTFGYIPPEYAFDGRFSEKSDVFAFGVIVLEIVSGKRSTGFYQHNGSYNLLGYAWEHWKDGTALEMMDSNLSADHPPEQEMVVCIQIGLLCVQERATDRPSMSTVIAMLAADPSDLPKPQEPAFSTARGPQ